MAAPKGNQNAAKGALVRDEFIRALELYKPEDRRSAHFKGIIMQVVAKAMEGDLDAVKIIFERIDGKPKQQLELSNNPENPLTKIEPTMPIVEATTTYRDSLKPPGVH